ncbi:MAG: hypothetical protein NC416_02490 [Eubacterium sp.]|nr:hypothetical protein [Eubacterium sp.]
MKQQIEVDHAVITFLDDVKTGKYANIEKDIIELPRNSLSRDEYVFEEEDIPVFYSMSN